MRIVAFLAFTLAFGAAEADAAYRMVIDSDGMMRPALPAQEARDFAISGARRGAAPASDDVPLPVRSPRRAAGEQVAASTHTASEGAPPAGRFEELLGATTETSAGLKASQSRGRAAAAAVWREWSALLPAIEAGGRLTHEKVGGQSGYGTLSVSMALFDPAAYHRGRGAQSRALAAGSDTLAARDRLLIGTAASWLRGAYALSATREYRASVAQLERVRRSVKAREGSGFASAADVNAVDARIASLRRETATLEEIAAKADAEIASATGGRVKLTADLPSHAGVAGIADSELAAMIVARSPTLQSAVFASDAALFESDAARSEYLPKVRVSGDYTSAGVAGYGPAADDLTIGVRLSVPVFEAGYIASISERNELAQAARWEAEDTQRRVELQVETLLRERDAAQAKRKQAEAEIGELENLVKSLDARYREGFGTIDELLNQQVALARTRAQAVEIRTQQLYTVFQLMVLAGLADDPVQ